MARSDSHSNGGNLGFEAELFKAADKLRGNMEPSDYKHVVLGLIFLKYISDAFEAKHRALLAEDPQAAEDKDEYLADNVFWVPEGARWSHLKASARQPNIGALIDEAMRAIEKDNESLKGVLPKDYARPALNKVMLGELIDLISGIALGKEGDASRDILGRVYEYFLGQFAGAEGKRGGEFYTPRSVVKLLVEMLEPYHGRVYDPCCGSGGMFVQSEKFVREHGGRIGDIAIYGQESNYTTWRLAKMNLAVRGIDADIRWNNEGSFHKDELRDIKADYILANPPFNISDWGGERLRDDPRWQFGVPPVGNANYAWLQHIYWHLAPNGTAGVVLANGSMSSNQSGEGEIRKAMIEADVVDCMVALPGQLFYSTQIPACLWFITRHKRGQPSPGASRHPLPRGEGHFRGGFDFSGLLDLAREMRSRATPAEAFAWELLRDRRFLGLKFRRQHRIGSYVVDFYCDEKKLVLELDGPVQDDPRRDSVDQKRDAYLRSQGLTVLRLPNEAVLNDTQAAMGAIAETINPSPSGRGAGVRGTGFRDRRGEILFVDARRMGHLVDRTRRELTDEEIKKIADTYHAWSGEEGAGEYADVPGFCKSATLDDIRKHGYLLTPGRYVGAAPTEEDGEPFEEKMQRLTAQWRAQRAEAARLDAAIEANLKALGYGK